MSRSAPARPELLALLSDVKDNPDDLTPWLVLTDWLEEHGDEADAARAEYCRLCHDKLGKKVYASDWEKGERRRELFRRYKRAWFGPLVDLPGPGQASLEVRRGLLHVWTGLSALLPVVDEVPREAWAWVEQLSLRSQTCTELERLAVCPCLAGPHHFNLSFHPDQFEARKDHLARAIKALADSPHLGGLRSFRFFCYGMLLRSSDSLFAPLKARLGDVFSM
jgi:uncharacterized protein (TIGR02996 family)